MMERTIIETQEKIISNLEQMRKNDKDIIKLLTDRITKLEGLLAVGLEYNLEPWDTITEIHERNVPITH